MTGGKAQRKRLRQLAEAMISQQPVRIRRAIPNATTVSGLVQAVGEQWVLIGYVDDRIRPDGWRAIRLDDISSIRPDPYSSFVRQALEAAGQWPLPQPETPIELDSTPEALTMAGRVAPLVAISTDESSPDSCWIGSITKIGKRRLTLMEVTPNAEWETSTSKYDLAAITEIGFGGGYEASLYTVASRHQQP